MAVPRRPKPATVIGRIDDAPFDCDGVYPWSGGKGRCGSRTFDVIEEWRYGCRVQCPFCLATVVVPAEGLEVHRPDEFRFPEGLFAGKTLDQTAELEDGVTYIEFMSRKAKSEEVARKCKAWIDSRRGGA